MCGHEAHNGEILSFHRVIEFCHLSSFLSSSLRLVSLSSSLQFLYSCFFTSSTLLADSLTRSVPLAKHSALIMRIISSHHSPRCAFSISSGLFTWHQTPHIHPFICLCVLVPQSVMNMNIITLSICICAIIVVSF